MKIMPVDNLNFGVLNSTKKRYYAPFCWNTKTLGKYKGYDVKILDNYIDEQLCSTLISISKAGKWIISKLKYFENNKKKTLWSYANDSLL